MIKYDEKIPFVEHFGMYQIPATMADAVEQFRIDSLTRTMAELEVGPEIFELLVTEDDSKTSDFGTLYDPIAYFADSSLIYAKPSATASMPPVPSNLALMGVGGQALWVLPPTPKALRQADSLAIVKVALLVATSLCDGDFITGDREANLRYIALNSVDHPASEILRDSSLWKSYRHEVTIPDMVAIRRADFVKLFSDAGAPLEPRERECLNRADLLGCASDLRRYILDRNRHVVFCKKCANEMLYLNAQVMSPPTAHVC
jgi:hypothetical protein